MDFKLKVMLRSTTALMVDLCRGRIWGDVSHFTETVWKMIAREEWLGCRHDASPMFDIPGSTPVWALYMLFFYFYDILCACFILQNGVYIYMYH